MPSPAHLRAIAALSPAPAPTINARSPVAIADPPETDAGIPMLAGPARYRAKASRDARL
jgi:hypothetical protein